MKKRKISDKTQKLYGGKIELGLDRYHRYALSVNGGKPHPVPGVTTVLKVMDRSEPLIWWSARCTVDYVREHLLPGESLDEIQIETMLENAYKAHTAYLREAASIGTLVHDYAQKYALWQIGKAKEPKPPENEKARNGCRAFWRWNKLHDVKYLSVERMVYSCVMGVAGTMDVLAQIDGQIGIIGDYKTANGIYLEHEIQASIYAEFWEEESRAAGKKQKIKQCWLVRFDKETGDFEDHYVPDDERYDNVETFRHLIPVHHRIAVYKQRRKAEEADRALNELGKQLEESVKRTRKVKS